MQQGFVVAKSKDSQQVSDPNSAFDKWLQGVPSNGKPCLTCANEPVAKIILDWKKKEISGETKQTVPSLYRFLKDHYAYEHCESTLRNHIRNHVMPFL